MSERVAGLIKEASTVVMFPHFMINSRNIIEKHCSAMFETNVTWNFQVNISIFVYAVGSRNVTFTDVQTVILFRRFHGLLTSSLQWSLLEFAFKICKFLEINNKFTE